MEKPVIYFDNNATTRTDPKVVEAMLPWFTDYYGNASSMHAFGDLGNKAVGKARQQIAERLGCAPDEIYFTSGGTESDNLAIQGVLAADPTKRHIITTKAEHPAVLSVCRWLEKHGYSVTYLGIKGDGLPDVQAFLDALRPDTALASVMWANNETGNIFPVQEMAAMAAAAHVPFHTDAVQAAGKIPIDLADTAINLLSLSGHKLHGPKGIGVLYVRKGTQILPFMRGGHQERGVRPGTTNVPAIVGLGLAAELASEHMRTDNHYIRNLRDKLERGLEARIPRVKVNGSYEHRLPNTTNISFEFVEGEAILLRMSHMGLAASSGSACTSGSLEPSHVLRAMGIPYTLVNGSVRFSLSRFNTAEEVDRVLAEMPGIIADLRAISPFWDEDKHGDAAAG